MTLFGSGARQSEPAETVWAEAAPKEVAAAASASAAAVVASFIEIPEQNSRGRA
jgi:hypothetical protein